MSEGYTVRLPFTLPSENAIDVAEAPRRRTLAGFPAALWREAACYVLEVSGIPSAEDARALLKRLGTGLLWATIVSRFGVRLSDAGPQHIKEHGRMQADIPAIYKGAEPRRRGRTLATLTALRQPEPFLDWIGGGAALACSGNLAGDGKLARALDQYCAAQFEATPAAKFFTLCTALETAAPKATVGPDVAKDVEEHVERWKQEAKAFAEAAKPGSDVQQVFNDLAERVGNLKAGAHGKRIRTYVRDTLRADGDPEADATARKIQDLYGIRGRLSHGDAPRLGDAPSRLDRIVARVLTAAMRQEGR
jgi:hypothetical protein